MVAGRSACDASPAVAITRIPLEAVMTARQRYTDGQAFAATSFTIDMKAVCVLCGGPYSEATGRTHPPGARTLRQAGELGGRLIVHGVLMMQGGNA